MDVLNANLISDLLNMFSLILKRWDLLHPLVVHFPIALLLITPIFVVLGIIFPSKTRCFLFCALLLMLLGTGFTYIAVSSGEAAEDLVVRSPEISLALERHEKLADITRSIFTILTVCFIGIFFLSNLLKKRFTPRLVLFSYVVFLIFYVVGIIFLANTAHQGGLLVHKYGVQAVVPKNF